MDYYALIGPWRAAGRTGSRRPGDPRSRQQPRALPGPFSARASATRSVGLGAQPCRCARPCRSWSGALGAIVLYRFARVYGAEQGAQPI
jgi:hypothetical protein